MPCAPFRRTFSTPQCFRTYSLPSALQNQYFCVAVYPVSSSLLPLLHVHGCSFSSTLQFISIMSINLMLKLPCSGRWSLLLLAWAMPTTHTQNVVFASEDTRLWGLQGGFAQGSVGKAEGWQPAVYLEQIRSQESSEPAGWHPSPHCSCSTFTWASPELCSGSDHSLLVILCHSWVCLKSVQRGEEALTIKSRLRLY